MSRRMALRTAKSNKARKTEIAIKALMEKEKRHRMDIAYEPWNDRYVYSDGSPVDNDDPRVGALKRLRFQEVRPYKP